jgi:hypothetical protein
LVGDVLVLRPEAKRHQREQREGKELFHIR